MPESLEHPTVSSPTPLGVPRRTMAAGSVQFVGPEEGWTGASIPSSAVIAAPQDSTGGPLSKRRCLEREQQPPKLMDL